MKFLAQAYSIERAKERSIDRWMDGWFLAGGRPICGSFSPSGGGRTSLSLETRKSGASLEELRVVRRRAKLEFAVPCLRLSQTRSEVMAKFCLGSGGRKCGKPSEASTGV